jgi:hypothetical protein
LMVNLVDWLTRRGDACDGAPRCPTSSATDASSERVSAAATLPTRTPR